MSEKRVLLSGGTGFIGKPLCALLKETGYGVTVLTRHIPFALAVLPAGVDAVLWDGRSAAGWGNLVEGAFAVVNLAGDSLSSGRWTRQKKERILQSRLFVGAALTEAVLQAQNRPQVFIQASAVGYYDHRSSAPLDESSPSGRGFLSSVCSRWEDSTREIEKAGVRRVVIRSGLVLGPGDGILARFLPSFRHYLGGYFGLGNRSFPWIHLEDEIRAIIFLLEHKSASGAYNLVSPGIVSMKSFARSLGKALKRPSLFPIPTPVLRLFFGQMAEEALLADLLVQPLRLKELDFRFAYPELGPALGSLLGCRPE